MKNRRRTATRLRYLATVLRFTLALAPFGCATLRGLDPGKPLVPSQPQARTGPFALYSNRSINPTAPALRTLRSLERELEASLGLKTSTVEPPVEVYVLEDREAFAHFLTFYYPELPPRRAFFLAQGPRRVVYTYENDRLEEDLRHEATHALLHAAIGDLPLWLDEGLAEYFEVPGDRGGINVEHLTRLPDDIKGGWRPDLARLETLSSVREMTPRDYRESWAWVHYLLDGSPEGKKVLLSYLADLHQTSAAALSSRLEVEEDDRDERLLSHVARLRALPLARAPRGVDPTILLQDAPIDREPPGRNWWERLGAFFRISRR